MVSIIVPAFNAKDYIAECLDSVAVQSYRDWEIIVVEDGSNDGTEAIVKQFASGVSAPVHFIRHEFNRGLPAARNTGIRAAQGEYIALLDSDDYWAPDHLKFLVETFRQTECALAYSDVVVFSVIDGNWVRLENKSPFNGTPSPTDLYIRSYIQPSAAAFHRSVLEVVGFFDETLRPGEDIDYWIRIAKAGLRIASTGKETCFYRKHAGAMTTNGAAFVEAGAHVYARHLDWDTPLKPFLVRRTSDTFAAAGKMNFKRNPKKAAKLYYSAWRLRPWRLDYLSLASAAQLRSTFHSS
jgi:glycosyltransferase involved in cell wall biosynthesis